MFKISKIKGLNEFVFSFYIFSVVILMMISKLFGKEVNKLLYITITLTLFIISLIKNRKILVKKDIILLIITIAMFVIDFFRKSQYMVETYVSFIKLCYIPCYFFNRTNNIKKVMKYMSMLSKTTVLLYIFDPLFGYHFSGDYMGYAYIRMLPPLFAIYVYYLIRRNPSDIIYLIFGTTAVIIYGNRTCLLSIIFMLILTFKLLIRNFKKSKRTLKRELNNIIKKICIAILLFAISFGANYLFIVQPYKQISLDKNDTNETSQSIEKENNSIKDVLTVESYSVNKYKELFEGKYTRFFSGRLDIYSNAIEVIKETYSTGVAKMLFGNGTGYYRDINNGIYSHSIILDLLIEYGLVGTILFGGLFLYCLFKWFKDSKKETFLFGAYWLCLAFPKLLLSQYFQQEKALFLFIIFVITYFSIKNKKQKTINI